MAEQATARGNEVDRRTMIVGPGMSFNGEIGSCDRLIIEGSITATVRVHLTDDRSWSRHWAGSG